MKLQFKAFPSKGMIFDQHAFDKQIGKRLTTQEFGKAKLLAVEVIENGNAALITIDTVNGKDLRDFGGRAGHNRPREPW